MTQPHFYQMLFEHVYWYRLASQFKRFPLLLKFLDAREMLRCRYTFARVRIARFTPD